MPGVLHGIGHQLEPGLGDSGGIDHRPGEGHRLQPPAALTQGEGLVEDHLGEFGDVGAHGRDEVALGALGQQDQVAHEHSHPVELINGQQLSLAHVSGVGRVGELKMPADHGDGRTQLVADVIEQVALRLHRGLHPVQHPVDGSGQGGQIVSALNRDPGGQVVLADGLGGASQLLDGAQEPLDGEPGQAGHQGDGEDGRRGVEGHGAQELGLGDLEVDDVHERPVLGAALDRDDEDPVARRGRTYRLDDRLRRGGPGCHVLKQLRILLRAEGDVVGGDPGQFRVGAAPHESELGLTGPLRGALHVDAKHCRDVLQGLAAGGIRPVHSQLADPVSAVLEPVRGIGRYAGEPQRPHDRPAGDERDARHQHDRPHDTGTDGDGAGGH